MAWWRTQKGRRALLAGGIAAGVMLLVALTASLSHPHAPDVRHVDRTVPGHAFTDLFPLSADRDVVLQLQGSAPVDILAVDGANHTLMHSGVRFHAFAPDTWANRSTYDIHTGSPTSASWWLVLHADTNATVHATLTDEGGAQQPGSLAAALSLRADFWTYSPTSGVHAITLWMLVLCLPAVWLVRRSLGVTALWTAGATAAAFVASEATSGGVLLHTAAPGLVGIVAALATRNRIRTRAARYAAVYLMTFLGSLLGADVLSGLLRWRSDWNDGVGVIGGAGWHDALVLAPAVALLNVVRLDAGNAFVTRRDRGVRRLDGLCGSCNAYLRLTPAQAAAARGTDALAVACPKCAVPLAVGWKEVTRNPGLRPGRWTAAGPSVPRTGLTIGVDPAPPASDPQSPSVPAPDAAAAAPGPASNPAA